MRSHIMSLLYITHINRLSYVSHIYIWVLSIYMRTTHYSYISHTSIVFHICHTYQSSCIHMYHIYCVIDVYKCLIMQNINACHIRDMTRSWHDSFARVALFVCVIHLSLHKTSLGICVIYMNATFVTWIVRDTTHSRVLPYLYVRYICRYIKPLWF